MLGRRISPELEESWDYGAGCIGYKSLSLALLLLLHEEQFSFLFLFVLAFIRGFPSTTALFGMVCPLEWHLRYNELY